MKAECRMTKETRMTKSENRARPTFSVISSLLLATGCTTVEDYSLTYELPVYLESNATFLRVALTPVAVAGDTVMVALVASVVAAYAFAAGALR